jgi:anti-anti-sigma regulatory factor
MSTKKRPVRRVAQKRAKSLPKLAGAASARAKPSANGSAPRNAAKPPVTATVAKVAPNTAAAGKTRREAAAKQVCRLTGSLVIRDARASLAQLCSALESGCTSVDVSGIDSIDTSGVQLLLAAAMEWRRREQSLTLTGYEHLIFGAAEQLGLQTLLPAAGGVES